MFIIPSRSDFEFWDFMNVHSDKKGEETRLKSFKKNKVILLKGLKHNGLQMSLRKREELSVQYLKCQKAN